MIELEENKKLLLELETKITNLGDSLWHSWFTNTNKTIRRNDESRRLLE